jgi:hypothetical protein
MLKDQARHLKLQAEQQGDLFERQRVARSARTYSDELGMIHVHLAWEPHVGTPIANRAQAEAARVIREAKNKDKEAEPFERHLADAYARLFSGPSRGRARRPELVVLVSHGVAKRGWRDVREGEVCKMPGIGPVSPPVAREIARDAFLSGVFYDGVDLRHLRRWTRSTPVEVLLALELGDPPGFDGIRCVDCGNRFGTSSITSNPTSPLVLPPPITSSPDAGPATRPRPNGTAKQASSDLPIPDRLATSTPPKSSDPTR